MTAWTRTKGVAAKRDHVSWSSEPGRVSGTIIAIHTGGIDYTGHPHHAGQDDSAYEIHRDLEGFRVEMDFQRAIGTPQERTRCRG
jgi:hypothetical protein